MKKIVMDYEKRQDKEDRELYASNRLLKAHNLPIKCLDEQKRALRTRLRIETNPDRMTSKILSGNDFDDFWEKVSYPKKTRQEAQVMYERYFEHGIKEHGLYTIKTKWVQQNGTWVSYQHYGWKQ